ncbi:ArsR/SmtB family transcription factor [Devosia aquimaris]|uniref:ArsR/SmtB family transcription factor n=1 Tax=Devosia aquimaris TaxID=2866214 RepID=UPI001CD13DD5|nr:helix-turn-helix domain-containing protein [Devosia sp. CJK-A8-3]
MLETIASQLEALGNPTRLAAYRLLVRAGPKGLPVGGLQAALCIPASTLSHHLRRLVGVDLVIRERQGTQLLCRANFAAMDGLVDFLSSHCCADARAEAAA